MQLKAISWVGTRTDNVDEMVRFCTQVLGLNAVHLEPELAVFALPNGDVFEIMGAVVGRQQPELAGLPCPKADFLVTDVKAARAEMEQQGVEFIGPIYTTDKHSWTHFKAPDGHLYGLTDDPSHPAHRS